MIALYRRDRRESVGITWRPYEAPDQPQSQGQGNAASRTSGTFFASPDEFARLRSGMAAEGADDDWLEWALKGNLNEEDGEA